MTVVIMVVGVVAAGVVLAGIVLFFYLYPHPFPYLLCSHLILVASFTFRVYHCEYAYCTQVQCTPTPYTVLVST